MQILTIDENCNIGKHFYVGESALLLCLSGSGWINDNGDLCMFEADDAAYFKRGEYYSLRNAEQHTHTQNGRPAMEALLGIVYDADTKPEDAPLPIGKL